MALPSVDLGLHVRVKQTRIRLRGPRSHELQFTLPCLPSLGHLGVRFVRAIGFVDPRKDGLQSIVVSLGNRIEFVMMATSAVDAGAGKGRHDGRDDIVTVEVSSDFTIEGVFLDIA